MRYVKYLHKAVGYAAFDGVGAKGFGGGEGDFRGGGGSEGTLGGGGEEGAVGTMEDYVEEL